MKNIRSIILHTALLLATCTIVPATYAQGPGFDDGVEDTPIDGGVSLVAAAAIGYGAKKLKEKHGDKRAK